MSRRGRSGPTISLFSFQDIITSVTAIVTVITLLLALDLVQRKQSKASDSSTMLAVEVLNRLRQAEAELAALQTTSATTEEITRDVAATSPAELRAEIAERESAIEALERERTRLQHQAEATEARRKDVLVEQFDLEPAKRETSQVELTITELERQRREELAENRLVYALPRGTTQAGWLIEVDGSDLLVAPLGRPAKPLKFTAGVSLFSSSAVKQLEHWIDREKLFSAYFLILVRPNGSNIFGDVQASLLRKKISHGSDLIGEDQVVLHPERGAAP